MPPPNIGPWNSLVARLTRHGDVRCDDEGTPQAVEDTYTVYLPTPSTRLDLSTVQGLPQTTPPGKHPVFSNLSLVGYRVAEHEPGQLFREIICEYEADGDDESSGGDEPQEIGKLVALDYPSYTATFDLATDQLTGAPVINAAGDVFDSVPQIETVWTGVHFTRRVKSHPAAALALSGSVNSASVTVYGLTFAPRTARVRVTSRFAFDGSRRPYELDVTIEPRHAYVDSSAALLPTGVEQAMGYATVAGRGYDIGWDVALLECGFQYLNIAAGSGEKVRFTTVGDDGSETAPQLPQLLKSDGDSNQAGTYPPVYLIVRTAAGNSWDALNLVASAPSRTDPEPD